MEPAGSDTRTLVTSQDTSKSDSQKEENNEAPKQQNKSDNTDSATSACENVMQQTVTEISGNKCFVLCTGKTLNAHLRVIDHLKTQQDLQKVDSVEECDFILVFCPITTRAGTDIEAAVKKIEAISGTKPAFLVVLHHTFDNQCVVPDSKRAVTRKNIITVDCLFHEDQGLLQCHKNDQSLAKIINTIKPQVSSTLLGSQWHFSINFMSTGKVTKEEAVEQCGRKTNENNELRLVLLGRTGSGWDAVRNTILGTEERNQASTSTATSTATQCSKSSQGKVAGRNVTLVETPDWFSPGIPREKLRQDVGLCVRLSAPGPHAFLLVIPVKQTMGDGQGMLEKMEEIFGESCWRNTMIIFSVTDELQKKNDRTEEFIQSGDQEIQKLVEKCENRFQYLNIKESGDGSQVSELLKKIEKMVGGSREKFYSSEIYQKTLFYFGEIEKKIEKIEKVYNPERKKEYKDEKKRKIEQDQVEDTEVGIGTEQNSKKLKENSRMGIQEMHKEEVNMEAERNEMMKIFCEIWRSILKHGMRMQENFSNEDVTEEGFVMVP